MQKELIKKYYQHDGEQQFSSYKKVHVKTYRLSKKENILVVGVLFSAFCVEQKCIARNENFTFFFWQYPYPSQRQIPNST